MHIRQIRIENIRSLKSVTWSRQRDPLPGWHVLIGDNGSGKSTLLRAVALAMIGPSEAAGIRQDWTTWLTQDANKGLVDVSVSPTAPWDNYVGQGRTPAEGRAKVGIRFQRGEDGKVALAESKQTKNPPKRHLWGARTGWFSASYGPYRRFSGGDKDYNKLFYARPRLAAHLSVFGEAVALTEVVEWLKELKFRKLEGRPEGDLLDDVREFINADHLLPGLARLHDVTSEGVVFKDARGVELLVDELSDGYRAVLSMTLELIRQMANMYGADKIFDQADPSIVVAPGVVMVDEIDAHLHPRWQIDIGYWFLRHFPNVQFLVTTHSPLVCHAAEKGSVFRLSAPLDLEEPGFVEGVALKRLVYGNILDGLSTGAFDIRSTRSKSSQEKLARLAELSIEQLEGQLSASDESELLELQEIFPSHEPVGAQSRSRR